MEILSGFRKNMEEAKEVRAKKVGDAFTPQEITTDAAMTALNIAALRGQDRTEIDRRAKLIKGSDAYKSTVEKIDEQLRELGY